MAIFSSSRAVPAFLAVSWTSDLAWKILHTLEENPQIRHGIWPGEREKSVGNTKIAYYEKVRIIFYIPCCIVTNINTILMVLVGVFGF